MDISVKQEATGVRQTENCLALNYGFFVLNFSKMHFVSQVMYDLL